MTSMHPHQKVASHWGPPQSQQILQGLTIPEGKRASTNVSLGKVASHWGLSPIGTKLQELEVLNMATVVICAKAPEYNREQC